MNEWRVLYTHDALKDKKKAIEAGFGEKVKALLSLLREDPFTAYPPYEKLVGDLSGAYSRRINRQHRLVYMVLETSREVRILSFWNHYE